jgi:hypothetical protein
MPESAYNAAKNFYKTAANSTEGKKLLSTIDWSQIYQFEIGDSKPFYINNTRGKLSMHQGRTPEKEFKKVLHIKITSTAMMKKIFKGEYLPDWENDKVWIWAGGRRINRPLMSILTRIGRDTLQKEAAKKYKM